MSSDEEEGEEQYAEENKAYREFRESVGSCETDKDKVYPPMYPLHDRCDRTSMSDHPKCDGNGNDRSTAKSDCDGTTGLDSSLLSDKKERTVVESAQNLQILGFLKLHRSRERVLILDQ